MVRQKRLSNRQANEEVKLNVVRLYELTKSHRESEKEYNKEREKLQRDISNFLFTHGIDGCEFRATIGNFAKEPKVISAKRIKRKRITYFAEKLEKLLGKEKSKKVINKTYVINDFKGLVAYLKECGVDPKIFKTFIDVQREVDTKSLEQMYELGDVTLEEIKGSYNVDTICSYIDVKICEDEEMACKK